ILFNQDFDGGSQLLINFGRCLRGLVVHRAPRYLKPTAQLAETGLDTFIEQALLNAKNHLPSSSNKACSFFRARNSSIASPYASCRSRSWRSYCSRTSSGLARKAFSIPRLPSSTQLSISEGIRS